MDLTQLLEQLQNTGVGTVSLGSVLYTLFLLIIAYVLIRLLRRQLRRALEKSRMEKGLKNLISNIVRVGLWVLALVIIAERLGIPTSSVVTALGVAGLALSLSLQDMLTNVFSGMLILATRPFVSGDFVAIGDSEGTVAEVGIFYTTLLTADQKRIHVPNKDVATGRIQNFSSQPSRRVELRFPLPLNTDPEAAKAVILKAAGQEERLTEPAPAAVVTGYANGFAEFSLRVWVKNSDYWDVYFRLNETVPRALREAGIPLASGSLNIQIDSSAK